MKEKLDRAPEEERTEDGITNSFFSALQDIATSMEDKKKLESLREMFINDSVIDDIDILDPEAFKRRISKTLEDNMDLHGLSTEFVARTVAYLNSKKFIDLFK